MEHFLEGSEGEDLSNCRDDVHHISTIFESLFNNGFHGGEVLIIDVEPTTEVHIVKEIDRNHFIQIKIWMRSLLGGIGSHQQMTLYCAAASGIIITRRGRY